MGLVFLGENRSCRKVVCFLSCLSEFMMSEVVISLTRKPAMGSRLWLENFDCLTLACPCEVVAEKPDSVSCN